MGLLSRTLISVDGRKAQAAAFDNVAAWEKERLAKEAEVAKKAAEVAARMEREAIENEKAAASKVTAPKIAEAVA